MPRILIAEDQPPIAEFLDKGLRANGFATTVLGDGQEVIRVADSEKFELLILDIGLPRKNGLQVLEELRGRGERLRIIILTARHDVSDKVAGLELGADDYVTKPFRFEELLARVRVQLRSYRALAQQDDILLRAGDIALDLRSRRILLSDSSIELSAREFILAETFLRHPGQVLSREQLLSHVWGYDYDPSSNIVDVYIGYLRRKLGSEKIETIRGMGYRLCV